MSRLSSILLFMTLLISCSSLGIVCKAAEAKNLTLITADNYHIAAKLVSPSAKAQYGAVLLHMYKNNKESWRPLIPALNDKGITALAIDMRGHGESRFGPDGRDNQPRVARRDPQLFNEMYLDALAAINYLHDSLGIRYSKIAIVGASVGCSVAIQAAVSQTPVLGAVVVMTPGKNYLGVETMTHLQKWPGIPLLILSSQEEKHKGAVVIFKTLSGRGATLKLFRKENIHGTFMFGEVDKVEELIANWLAKRI